MLRKSEKSVVLLLQQDHPCRKFETWQTLARYSDTNYWNMLGNLPLMHHEILGLLGERCRHL